MDFVQFSFYNRLASNRIDMILIICVILLLFGFVEYIRGKKGIGALVFFFFLTDGFHFLDMDWTSMKYSDFGLIYMGGIFIINLLSGNLNFFQPKINVYKFAAIILLFITAEFIRTVGMHEEITNFAIRNYRTYIPLLSFFLVQELSLKEQKLLLKQIAFITIISSILYVLQPVFGVQIFQHARITEENGTLRYRNIPYLLYFYLIYITVVFKIYDIKKILLLVVFIMAILLTQHRAIMFAYVACVLVYMISARKFGRMMQLGIAGSLLFLLAGDTIIKVFEERDKNRETTTLDDIRNVMNLDYESVIRDDYDDESDGTLSFRVLLLLERYQYLKDNPKYYWFGIGTRHEDSPYTEREFNFILGSARRNQAGEVEKIAQTSSGDLAWLNPLMRFGVVGIAMFICFSFLILRYLYKNRKQSDISMSAFLFYLFLIMISFKNDHLYGNMQMFFVYLLISYTHKLSETKNIIGNYKRQIE